MPEAPKQLDFAIEVLVYLAKAGPTSVEDLAAHFTCSRWWMRLFLHWLRGWGWICPDRPYWRFPWRATICFRLTDGGRNFLRLHDELDPRAPFARFENEA